MSPEDALTQALAALDGQEPTKGHRLRAIRIINQLTDRGFDVTAVSGRESACAGGVRINKEAA